MSSIGFINKEIESCLSDTRKPTTFDHFLKIAKETDNLKDRLFYSEWKKSQSDCIITLERISFEIDEYIKTNKDLRFKLLITKKKEIAGLHEYCLKNLEDAEKYESTLPHSRRTDHTCFYKENFESDARRVECAGGASDGAIRLPVPTQDCKFGSNATGSNISSLSYRLSCHEFPTVNQDTPCGRDLPFCTDRTGLAGGAGIFRTQPSPYDMAIVHSSSGQTHDYPDIIEKLECQITSKDKMIAKLTQQNKQLASDNERLTHQRDEAYARIKALETNFNEVVELYEKLSEAKKDTDCKYIELLSRVSLQSEQTQLEEQAQIIQQLTTELELERQHREQLKADLQDQIEHSSELAVAANSVSGEQWSHPRNSVFEHRLSERDFKHEDWLLDARDSEYEEEWQQHAHDLGHEDLSPAYDSVFEEQLQHTHDSMSGHWQRSTFRQDTAFDERMALDLQRELDSEGASVLQQKLNSTTPSKTNTRGKKGGR